MAVEDAIQKPNTSPTGADLVTHAGSCHCNAVRFTVDAPADLTVWDCNCSICRRRRNTHFIVPKEAFRLETPASALTTYRFGTRVAAHTFCATCGITAFYSPRSNPDGIAVTVACIDTNTVRSVTTRYFDGENWEAAYAATGIVSCTAGKTEDS